MIHFDQPINTEGYTLVVSYGVVGYASILSAKLLISLQNFEKAGLYFSEYTGQSITVLPDGVQLNGEVYVNNEKKTLLIIFTSGVPSYYQRKFFEELNSYILDKKFKNTIFVAGFYSDYQNDVELLNPFVTPYYISNSQESIETLEKAGAKSFNKLCNLVDTSKPLKELDFISGLGSLEKYIKYQNKKKLPFTFLGSYVRAPIDVLASQALYQTILNALGFTDIQFSINKDYVNLKQHLSKLTFGEDWKILLESQ